jgi:hypothetical protein
VQHLAEGSASARASSAERSVSTTKCHGWWLPADGALIAATSSWRICSSLTRPWV